METKNLNSNGLFIPYRDSYRDAAFRIFDKMDCQVFYASTRLGTIDEIRNAKLNEDEIKKQNTNLSAISEIDLADKLVAENGYFIENIKSFIGMKYELKILSDVKIINGELVK